MRTIALILAIACALFSAIADAADEEQKTQPTLIEQLKQGFGVLNLGNERQGGVEPSITYGTSDRRIMPPYQTYDRNTGLQNVTESDNRGNLH